MPEEPCKSQPDGLIETVRAVGADENDAAFKVKLAVIARSQRRMTRRIKAKSPRAQHPLSDYPDDVRAVIQALAAALDGQPPIIERLLARIGVAATAVPGHEVSFTHVASHAHQTGRALFKLTIAGDRTNGWWSFRPGHLSKLVMEAQKALTGNTSC